MDAAKQSNLTVLVVGLDESQENENNDRESIMLPGVQNELIRNVSAVSNRTILVVITGGCVDISEWRDSENINAILTAGYPGMYGMIFACLFISCTVYTYVNFV